MSTVKVYLLFCTTHEHPEFLQVFATRAAAEKRISEYHWFSQKSLFIEEEILEGVE